MPRFAILAHDWPTPHFDLLLEKGDVLKTWRLAAEPGQRGVRADPVDDHRLFYLEYEGPISGDRGTVSRWDAGTYEMITQDCDRWWFELYGEKLKGWRFITRLAHGWEFGSAE